MLLTSSLLYIKPFGWQPNTNRMVQCHHFANADVDNPSTGDLEKDGQDFQRVIAIGELQRDLVKQIHQHTGNAYLKVLDGTTLANEIEISKKFLELGSMQHGNIERLRRNSSVSRARNAERRKTFTVTTLSRETIRQSSPCAEGVILRFTPLQEQRVRNPHLEKRSHCAHVVAVFRLRGSVFAVGQNTAKATGAPRRFQLEHVSRNLHCVVVVAGNGLRLDSARDGMSINAVTGKKWKADIERGPEA